MNDIVKAESKEVSVAAGNDIQITPMHMLQIAVDQGHDLEKIEKLMELERRWKADQAREAFYQALSAFKKESVTVTKDKVNKQYDSRYASIGNTVNTVSAALAKHGLSASWDIDQTEGIKVTCILTHTLGHNKSVSMSGLPDDSGKKNDLQKIRSTITYLESTTFQAVTGVVSEDAPDDDGNGASPTETISDKQAADIEAMITEVGANRSAFLGYLNVDNLEDLNAKYFDTAIKALNAKRMASK